MKVKIDNGDKLYRQLGWYLVDDYDKAIYNEDNYMIGGDFQSGGNYKDHIKGAQLEVVEKIRNGEFSITINEDGSVSFKVL